MKLLQTTQIGKSVCYRSCLNIMYCTSSGNLAHKSSNLSKSCVSTSADSPRSVATATGLHMFYFRLQRNSLSPKTTQFAQSRGLGALHSDQANTRKGEFINKLKARYPRKKISSTLVIEHIMLMNAARSNMAKLSVVRGRPCQWIT